MKNIFLILVFSILCFSGSCQSKKKNKKSNQDFSVNTQVPSKTLIGPIAESKIHKLIKGSDKGDHYDASGVYYLDNYFYVIFDNRYEIGKINSTLPHSSELNSLIGNKNGNSNYEAITCAKSNGIVKWFTVEESVARDTAYYPRINEFDADLKFVKTEWVEYPFTAKHMNKAFEGLAAIKRNNVDYMLGLVEGTGKIIVLQLINDSWRKVTEFTIPYVFDDYSDLTVYRNTIAVCSQEDAKLWVGKLDENTWSVVDKGIEYDFPKGNEDGTVGAGNLMIYGNVEGVSFINDSTIVTCTDRMKDKQPSYQKHKDQSVQVFRLR